MRPGEWNGRKTRDNVRVYVNGTLRPVRNVRIQSGMKDGHPAAETSSWCIEATIDWASPHLVDTGAPEPFTGDATWLPQDGDAVEIFTGDGALDVWHRQHVGWIDSTTGSFKDGTASSSTVDDVDELDKPVQYTALLAKMTPVQDGEPFRYQGMQSIWYVDRMLRDETSGARGWHATPPVTWQTIAAATGLGSLRPEVGTLIKASAENDVNAPASWTTTEDGHPYPTDYNSITTLLNHGTTREFVLTMQLPAGQSTTGGFIIIGDENQAGPAVGISDTDTFRFGHWNGVDWDWNYRPRGTATRVALSYERQSASTQFVTIRMNDGREWNYDTTTGSLPDNWRADRVWVNSGDAIGWWVLEDEKPAGQEWASLESVPTSRIRGDGFQGLVRWDASRDQPRQSAAESIEEQLTAECSAFWLNEDGHAEWAGRGVLEGQPVAQTVTTSLAVDDVTWGTRRRDGARTVTVQYLDGRVWVDPAGSMSRELWTDDSIDVGPGEEEIVTVTVPDDEEWIAEDLSPTHIYEWGRQWDDYALHSHFGGTQYRKESTDEAAWGNFINCSMTKIALREYEVTFGAWSTMSSAYRINSNFPPSMTAYARSGRSPLVMRGRAKIIWRERERQVDTSNTNAPLRYVHDVGWRVQNVGSDMTALLNWLGRELDDPKPTLTLTVAHDPRRQIGDMDRMEDPHKTGSWVEVLVQERDFDAGDFTDTIRGRIVDSGALNVSLPTPHGPTPTTPAISWDREVIS